MASAALKNPKIDWNAVDLDQEFERFHGHVGFVIAGPLSGLQGKQHVGWLRPMTV